MSLIQQESERATTVVYGVYDSSQQPLSVRIQDYFIDRQRIGVQEKSYFYHLLGVMLDAGIPIVKALRMLSKKTENERFTRIINTMAYDVERGEALSQSMTKFPDVFEEAEVGVVRSGEAIGRIEGLLFNLAEQTEKAHELFLKVRSALIYPATVLIALLISGFIVVTTVIPRLNEFFVQANVEMPVSTQIVLGVGQFMVQFFWILILLAVLVILLGSIYLRTEQGRWNFDRLLLSTPALHVLVRKYNVARFVQLLSLLVDSGVPIHRALAITSQAMNNQLYRNFVGELRLSVEKGEKLATKLAEAPFLFSETVAAMISVGENSGQLGSISKKLAQQYEREVAHALTTFTSLLEPVVIVFVGLAVGVLAMALLGPIFSLSNLVS